MSINNTMRTTKLFLYITFVVALCFAADINIKNVGSSDNGAAWLASDVEPVPLRLLAYDAESHSTLLVDDAGLEQLVQRVGKDACVAPVGAVGR